MEVDLSNLGTVNTMFAALFRWVSSSVRNFQTHLTMINLLFYLSIASWVSLSRPPFQLMFLKKLWMAQLQSDPFQLQQQLVERYFNFCFFFCWWRNIVFFLELSFAAGWEARCSFLWCDNKWAASWVRGCYKSHVNCTKQVQGMNFLCVIMIFGYYKIGL